MGVFIGGGLALAYRRAVDSRSRGPALTGAILAALVFPAEVLDVALGTDVGSLEMATTLLAWPVMTVVAAVHSADIAGRTRHHAWLWTGRSSASLTRSATPASPPHEAA
ncbi:hypothetical protein GA0115240_140622 [Streptomyces sp. DvalAA-14]|uniref:hypothetical protein n=1 Tax=unclassified Streptomyces TaxID=2593676 RepID=UPI00081B5479|nr:MULTISPECIES: hypothetical protein [unclassified Streptomyces]MYS22343.1 hypothetical protein [Streptomyces sp. SID4948]SCE14319.1 hypothetical protein GA0115240_140622 [Streptomyces sp. DvalAA-14]